MAIKYITKDLYAISGGQHSTVLRHTFEYETGIFTKWGGALQIIKKPGATTVVSINSGRFLVQGRFLENSIVQDVEVTGLTTTDKTYYLVVDIDLGLTTDPTFRILDTAPTILEDLTESDTAKRQETLATIVANSLDGIKRINVVINPFSVEKNDVYLKLNGQNKMNFNAPLSWGALPSGGNIFVAQAMGSGAATGSGFAQIGITNPTNPAKRCYFNIFDGNGVNLPYNRPHITIQNYKLGYNNADGEIANKGDIYRPDGKNKFAVNGASVIANNDVLFDNPAGILVGNTLRNMNFDSRNYRELLFILKPNSSPWWNVTTHLIVKNFANGDELTRVFGDASISSESSTTEHAVIQAQVLLNGTQFRYMKGSFITLAYPAVKQNVTLSQRDELRLFTIVGLK